MTTQSYRGYIIEPVFDYQDGTFDFDYYEEDNDGKGFAAHQVSLNSVKIMIDEKIEEETLTI